MAVGTTSRTEIIAQVNGRKRLILPGDSEQQAGEVRARATCVEFFGCGLAILRDINIPPRCANTGEASQRASSEDAAALVDDNDFRRLRCLIESRSMGYRCLTATTTGYRTSQACRRVVDVERLPLAMREECGWSRTSILR